VAAACGELVVAVAALHLDREWHEVVEGEVFAAATVDAAVAVAGLDAVALLAADREACALSRRAVACGVATSGAGVAA